MEPLRESTPDEIAATQSKLVTVGGDGLVVRVGGIPSIHWEGLIDSGPGEQAGIKEKAEWLKKIARLGLKTRLRFDEAGDGPDWDGLAMAVQQAIVTEIIAFSTAGMGEVAQAAATFRDGRAPGVPDGPPGAGPGDAGADVDEAAQVSGAAAGP